MMRNRKSKIQNIQKEIEELQVSIEKAKTANKKAFAARLTMMMEQKEKLLETWYSTP